MHRSPRFLFSAALLIAALWHAPPASGLTADRELTQYIHRIWQTQQGLPDGAITGILQDSPGYLWIATEAGMYRFDGVRFTPVERLIPSAPSGLFIRSAAHDPKGTLWLGGNDGNVYAVRRDGTTKYTAELGMPGGQLQCVIAGKSGIVWTCLEKGLVRIDPANTKQPLQVFHMSDGLPNENVRSACEAPDGTVWIGGETANITEYRGGRFIVHPLKGVPPRSPSVPSCVTAMASGLEPPSASSACTAKSSASLPPKTAWSMTSSSRSFAAKATHCGSAPAAASTRLPQRNLGPLPPRGRSLPRYGPNDP